MQIKNINMGTGILGAGGYYVDTVGKNTEKIKAYIQNQLNEDVMTDQYSLKEYYDPFTGSKNK